MLLRPVNLFLINLSNLFSRLTPFVVFPGKDLNSYGGPKLQWADGFQQSLLKSLFRSLRDKYKLICEDYGTLLEKFGEVAFQ